MRTLQTLALVLASGMGGCSNKALEGTHPDGRTEYVQGDGWNAMSCGVVVRNDVYWRAVRYGDVLTASVSMNFTNEKDATEWLTKNWCKP